MRREIRITERTPSGRGGQIVVVAGTMNTGKSALLVAEMLRLQAAYGFGEKEIQIFSFPVHDSILSGSVSVTASIVRTTKEIREEIRSNVSLVVIEEAELIDNETQGWRRGLLAFVLELAEAGVHFVIGGLLKTFEDEDFGCVPALAKAADRVVEPRAECLVCRERMAVCNLRLESVAGDEVEVVEKERYIRVCAQCHAQLAPDCHKERWDNPSSSLLQV